MRIHQDWSTPSFALPPVAAETGPFVRASFLETWWNHRAESGDELLLVDGGDALVPLVARNGVVSWAGEADLTDYHSPLGPGAAALLEDFFAGFSGDIALDSLPGEAAEVVAGAIDVAPERHQTAAVLELPATFDDWLSAIGKKERHEVRRKRRRCESELGTLDLRRRSDGAAFSAFFAMHRSAPGSKGTFMDAAMESLFAALAERAGFVLDVLHAEGRPVAAVFGWEDGDAYYLYNSAYDSAAAGASPGNVLLSMLVEREIGRGARIFDFLKGDETYKFRLGAEARPLYRFTGRIS